MFPLRSLSFVVFYAVLFFNGSEACFRINEHENISVKTGSPLYKECQCTEPGFTINNIQWLDNHDQPIQQGLGPDTSTTSKAYTEYQTDSVNLHISSITEKMSGTYKCLTQVNGITYTQSYTVTAYEPLYFYETPNDQYLIYGQQSQIQCKPISSSPVLVSWQKGQDDPVQINTDEKYLEARDGLYVNNVTKDDEGVYKCTARVATTNEEVDENISVTVITVPEIIKLIPDLIEKVVVGDNLTIECIADGRPHPDYVWNKTLTEDDSNNGTWRQELNAIIFNSIQPEDTGFYTCYAFNAAGFDSTKIFVDVLIPPEITYFPNITEVEKSTIQLFCNATGKPEPEIAMAYLGNEVNGETIFESDDIKISNMAYVNLDRSHQGFYECNATNKVGVMTRTMYLSVLHQPYFDKQVESMWGWEGKTINLTCIPDSNPPAKITWRFQSNNILVDIYTDVYKELLSTLNAMPEPSLTWTIDNETAYGVYECSATNEYGKSTKRITLTEGFRPGAVKNATYEDLTATAITFSLEGPDYVNGPAIQAFTAQYDEAGNYKVTDIHINRTWTIDREFKLDKLKPNTTYYVRFAALNEVGTGEWSEYLEFTTLEKSVPEPPVWRETPITVTRDNTVLSWKQPEDNGEPILYYTLQYCPIREGDTTCKKIKSTTTKLELPDLEHSTMYALQLIAHNAEGDSVAANINATVPARTKSVSSTILSSGAIIGISIVIVVLCLLILDALLLAWRRQGIIATCCFQKDNKRKDKVLNSRDKKGLLTNGETEEVRPSSRPNNGHKEFEYNKNTGVVTGKHSAV